MRHAPVARLATGLAVGLAAVLGATTVLGQDGGRPFNIKLTGAAERPDPGDPDGSGAATLRLNPGRGEVCYTIEVQNITLPSIGAHIHVGGTEDAGPIVVPLTPPDSTGRVEACSPVTAETARAILKDPANYYVNVHTTDFPPGAVRGQLSRAAGPKTVTNPHAE